MLSRILIIVAIAVLGFFGFLTLSSKLSFKPPAATPQADTKPTNNQPNQQDTGGGYGFRTPIFEDDGVTLQHYWPSEGSFSAEETELLLFNESNSPVEVKSFNLEYQVEGKTYPHKSGTWEKFPSRESWERAEYLNISPNYYKGEQLLLTAGQKGKLHWHINFGSQPLDGKQTVKVKLTLLRDGQTINIDEEFNRASGTVFSKENH